MVRMDYDGGPSRQHYSADNSVETQGTAFDRVERQDAPHIGDDGQGRLSVGSRGDCGDIRHCARMVVGRCGRGGGDFLRDSERWYREYWECRYAIDETPSHGYHEQEG